MFRKHALRTSRTAYLSSSVAVGAVVAEIIDSRDQSTLAEVVPQAPAESIKLTANDILGPEPPKTIYADLPEKLSIYPSLSSTLVLLDTPSPLELRIGHVRRQVCEYHSDARTQVQGVIDRWIHIEESVESRLKSFHDPAEPLNPGLLYTGVSALTAAVIVRSRALPVRFLFPPLSLISAFAYFLPRTAGRVGGWVEELEGKYAPRVGEVRRTSIAHTNMAFGMLGEKYKEGKDGLGKGARNVVEGIESSTGLRLSGAFGWGDDKKGSKDKSRKE